MTTPTRPVAGPSKPARDVTGYARRLQVQERLGRQTADAIHDELDPQGAERILTATTTQAWAGEWNSTHSDANAVPDEHNRSVAGFKGGPVW